MTYKAPLMIVGLALIMAHASAQATELDSGSTSTNDVPTVIYSQSSLVNGTSDDTVTLNIPTAGELFLTLTDLASPQAFGSLKFDVSSDPSALVGEADPGTLTLDLTGPTTLYASVFATAAQSSSDNGLYNLTATLLADAPSSPVPLPASGTLLGLALLLGIGLRAIPGGRRDGWLAQYLRPRGWCEAASA